MTINQILSLILYLNKISKLNCHKRLSYIVTDFQMFLLLKSEIRFLIASGIFDHQWVKYQLQFLKNSYQQARINNSTAMMYIK